MRTNLDIDDDVLAVAREVAARDRVSIGSVISARAREALRKPVGIRYEQGILVVDIPEDAPTTTNEMVRDALGEP